MSDNKNEESEILIKANDYAKEISKLRAENLLLKKMLKATKLKIKQQEIMLQNSQPNKSMYLQKYA